MPCNCVWNRFGWPEAGMTDSVIAFDFSDTWRLKAGVEYKVTERLALRGGYAFVINPVPDHTLNPGNPDSNQHNFSIGFGNKWNKISMRTKS
jgi:long-chain fatty acid transport protein